MPGSSPSSEAHLDVDGVLGQRRVRPAAALAARAGAVHSEVPAVRQRARGVLLEAAHRQPGALRNDRGADGHDVLSEDGPERHAQHLQHPVRVGALGELARDLHREALARVALDRGAAVAERALGRLLEGGQVLRLVLLRRDCGHRRRRRRRALRLRGDLARGKRPRRQGHRRGCRVRHLGARHERRGLGGPRRRTCAGGHGGPQGLGRQGRGRSLRHGDGHPLRVRSDLRCRHVPSLVHVLLLRPGHRRLVHRLRHRLRARRRLGRHRRRRRRRRVRGRRDAEHGHQRLAPFLALLPLDVDEAVLRQGLPPHRRRRRRLLHGGPGHGVLLLLQHRLGLRRVRLVCLVGHRDEVVVAPGHTP
mmetsp:Transcript_27619/g.60832  ORF Transcript_27619/g.60832 Transcript_27619/m.60832 type:complete len:362 (-) Transcript_27619:476-1561(-)